ncbi:MAG TPA: hypothetical protein VG144_00675 [Gaiellaceae bacterium]|nr:hypothetical protein [Gaiellaceae bacterium]
MRRMPHVAAAEDRVGQPSDRDRPAAGGEVFQETHRLPYFGLRRRAVRERLTRTVWVRRHHVPEQNVRLELQLRECTVDDRRRRLRRAGARELTLGGEREPADARAAVAGGLADEEIRRSPAQRQVVPQPLAAELRVGVLIERRADARPRELVDELALGQALPLR